MQNYLNKKYKDKYIIDIRDSNKILKLFSIKKAVENSYITVISSKGYESWLPTSEKYIVNHNTSVTSISGAIMPCKNHNLDNLRINYIGSIRDYDINIALIGALKDSTRITLNFHGDGTINKDIQNYLINNSINNVNVTGRYTKEQENNLYMESDVVNILIPDDDVNSKTLLPNRLYNALIHGKPILTKSGTYLANITEQFKLGIVIDSFDDIEIKILRYLESIDYEEFDRSRTLYLENVIHDNEYFYQELKNFTTEKF